MNHPKRPAPSHRERVFLCLYGKLNRSLFPVWTDQQVIQLFHQISASGDGYGTDFFTDALQEFQLFQTVQGLVLVHHLGGVQQAARGGGLFPAGDDVGLGFLFCDQDGVEDLLDIAGQNDILHSGVDEVNTKFGFFLLQSMQHLGRDLLFLLQQVVQTVGSDVFSQYQLQVDVDLFLERVDFQDFHRIRHPVLTDKVEAQGDFVGRHHLLSGQIQLLSTEVDGLQLDVDGG